MEEKVPEYLYQYLQFQFKPSNNCIPEKKGLKISTSSDFRDFVVNNKIIDKTHILKYLFGGQTRNVFLRPRRFGKSLAVSQIKYFFYGLTYLFKSLSVYNEIIIFDDLNILSMVWNPSNINLHNFPPCPVIHLDFSTLCLSSFSNSLIDALKNIANQEAVGDFINLSNVGACISSLITYLATSRFNKWGKVVILIDEYDFPFNSPDLTPNKRIEISKIIQSFFQQIKALDSKIVFAYVTGVTSYGMAGLFSGANNFVDVSFEEDLHDLCGFTHNETSQLLSPFSFDGELEKVIEYYNGYSWDIKSSTGSSRKTLMNPYSVVQYQNTRIFNNYWVRSSNENILNRFPDIIKLLPPPIIVPFSVLSSSRKIVSSNENIDLDINTKLLFESGYVTVKDIGLNDSTIKLDYPNLEISNAINSNIINEIINSKVEDNEMINNVSKSIRDGNIVSLFEFTNKIRQSAPFYRSLIYKTETAYQELLRIVTIFLGFGRVQSEESSALGRSDMAIYVSPEKSYVMELKILKMDETGKISIVGKTTSNLKQSTRKSTKKSTTKTEFTLKDFQKSAKEAIQQILDTKYCSSSFVNELKRDSQEIILIAVICVEDSSCRQIKFLKFEVLDKTTNTILPNRGSEIILP